MSSNEETNGIDVNHVKLTDEQKKVCNSSIEEMMLYYTVYPMQFFRDIKNMDYKTIFLVTFTFIINFILYSSILYFIYKKIVNN